MSKGKYKISSLHELLEQYDIELSAPIVIDGVKTNYFITSFGVVYTIKKNGKVKYTQSEVDSHGYHRIEICFTKAKKYYRCNVMLHRLVAMAFIPNPENKDEVNHIDGDKNNNHVSNLEWVTHSENMRHAYRNDLNHKGEANSQSVYTEKQIRHVCQLLQSNKLPKSEISENTGVALYTVDAILRKKKWKHISCQYDINYTVKAKNTGSTKKYTDEQIHRVCKLLEDGCCLRKITELTGVGQYTVCDIKKRKTWKYISNKYKF